MPELDVEQVIQFLGLQPLPVEGGLFRQTYRSADEIPPAGLPDRYIGQARGAQGESAGEIPHASPRPYGTAIFYLLTSQTVEFATGKIAGEDLSTSNLAEGKIASDNFPEGKIEPGNFSKGKIAGSNFSSFSAFHRLRSDEIIHFYLGDPLEMTLLYPDGSSRQVILGQDIFHGQQVQFVAPHGVWQGTRLVTGGKFALIGTTMAPGYSGEDFEHGSRAALLAQYPHERERILALTR